MMTTTTQRIQLSGNMLKIIAAIAMTVDHVGLLFFPTVMVFRCIGRIAMPIFAFMIAEGCFYTRSKLRYFLSVLGLGALCQAVYVVASGSWYLCMPVSFALSILLICVLEQTIRKRSLLWAALLTVCIGAVYVLTRYVHLDYGFWGCMLAVLSFAGRLFPDADRRLPVVMLGVGLIPLSLALGAWQWWSLPAVPLLLLYSGRRGKWKMKYFFYIFYPAHLAILQGIFWLLAGIG